MTIKYLISKIIKKMHIPSIRDSQIHRTSKVCSGAHVVDINLGKYSYVGNFCTVINTNIGNFCSIADNCVIGGANHPMDWVSTSPVFNDGKNIMKKNFAMHPFKTTKKTFIGNDVWIGTNCLIKNGISIGDGAVIGMGSVVTKDVGAYEIWAGNPAKILRKRFTNEVICKLLDIKWWNMDNKTLQNFACDFADVLAFIEQVEMKVENENFTLG